MKLGIVGFGRIVELVHLPIIQKIPDLSISGVFDITEQRRSLAEKRGFYTYKTLEELAQDDEVDAVLIATPPNSHHDLAIQMIECGKHVLIEKPMTIHADEARSIWRMAERHGVEVTVFHNRRFDPDFELVQAIIQSGRLGEILFVKREQHIADTGVGFGVKAFDPAWRVKAEYGGGALLDWGVHLLDQLLQLQLGEVQEVRSWMHTLPQANGEVDDYVQASLVLDSGALLAMEINFRSAAKTPLWVVGGEQGTLQVNSEKEAALYFKNKVVEKLNIERSSLSSAKKIYTSFFQAIRGTGVAEVKLEEVIRVMDMIEQIRQYEKQQQPISAR